MVTDHLGAAEFRRLRGLRLHRLTPIEWENYYERMAPFLYHEHRSVRSTAIERLCMAVTFAEWIYKRPIPQKQVETRVSWLLDALVRAHNQYLDVIPSFLRGLRLRGDRDPFSGLLREWLHSLKERPPVGVTADLIEGTLVLLGDCGSNVEQAAPIWRDLLGHSSTYVRACAAKMLGDWCGEPGVDADAIHEIEEERSVWVDVNGRRIRRRAALSERRLSECLSRTMAGRQRYLLGTRHAARRTSH